jgi:hypothetical protein
MLLTVHYHPAMIGTAMRRAMNIVNACRETTVGGEKGLSICQDLRVDRSRYHTIKIVVRNDLHQTCVSIGKSDAQGQYLMAAMRPSALRARRTHGDAAHHHIIDRMCLSGAEQCAQLLIDPRRAALWHWDGILRLRPRRSKCDQQNNEPA